MIKAAGFDNTVREGKNILIPKLMQIGFSINVVHDHRVGWDFATGEFRGGLAAPRFPYDFGLLRDTADTPMVGPTINNDTVGEGAAAQPPTAPKAAGDSEGSDKGSKAGDLGTGKKNDALTTLGVNKGE